MSSNHKVKFLHLSAIQIKRIFFPILLVADLYFLRKSCNYGYHFGNSKVNYKKQAKRSCDSSYHQPIFPPYF